MPYPHKITASDALQRTIEHREIFHDEMLHLMRLIMGGEMSPVMMAALITGLRVKKETIGEITAAAQVMREFSTKVNVVDKTHLVDIVGTGGDGSHTFNISTCSMFVAAAAGPARDIVILNAGAALYAANVAGTMKEGIDKARGVLASGAAKTRLEQLVKMTNEQASCA